MADREVGWADEVGGVQEGEEALAEGLGGGGGGDVGGEAGVAVCVELEVGDEEVVEGNRVVGVGAVFAFFGRTSRSPCSFLPCVVACSVVGDLGDGEEFGVDAADDCAFADFDEGGAVAVGEGADV